MSARMRVLECGGSEEALGRLEEGREESGLMGTVLFARSPLTFAIGTFPKPAPNRISSGDRFGASQAHDVTL